MASVNRSLLALFKQGPEWKDLTKLQKEFFYQFFLKKNIFLTGPAGTGKSYCVNLLFKFLEEQNIFFGKTATTGVAALNVGGITIHSWSGMGLADEDGMRLLDKVSENRKATNRIKNAKVLVVDEISMAKAELVEKLDIVCQFIRNNGKPFGGIQIVFVGDFLQLPPVFVRFEKEEFAFESQAWREAQVYTIHLTEIVRQHDEPEFATFLNEVRMGTCKNYNILDECICRDFPTDGIVPVKLFCKNIDVDKYNDQELRKIESPSHLYYSTDEGGEQWTKFFDKNCRAPASLELKVGAQVMLLKNLDLELKLVNGSVGVVTQMFSDTVEVKFTTGDIHVIEPQKWELKQIEDDGYGNMLPKVVASRKQIPLKLAWALTIHKCLHENSIIHLKKGGKYIKNVTQDDTYSVKNQYNKIKKVHTMNNQDALKITLQSGKELVCSPTHKIAVVNSLTNIVFEDSMSIKEGQLLLSKKGFPTSESSPISTEICWLLGALVGDGSYSNKYIEKGYRVDFCNIPTECGETYKKLAETLLGVKISRTKRVKGKKAITYYFHNKSVRNKLLEYGLLVEKREKKTVPQIIFQCNRDGIANFLCGLIDTDGHINKKNIVINNVAKQMLLEAQSLFEILGYKSVFGKMSMKPTKTQNQAYSLLVIGFEARRFLSEFSKYLKAVGKYKHLRAILNYPYKNVKMQINDLKLSDFEITKLREELRPKFGKQYGKWFRLHLPNNLNAYLVPGSKKNGLNRYILKKFVDEIPDFPSYGPVCKAIESAVRSNLYFDKVTSIEPVFDQNLIDITLDKEHTYFSNGLFHHNCQGSTLDRAEINASEAFAEGQVYVALSRVRNLGSLRMNQFHPSKVTVNKKCLDFYLTRPPIEADFFEEEEE